MQNAYLQVPFYEKHYVVCGPEFGLENVCKHTIIFSTLYDDKSSEDDYSHHVCIAMEEMGFRPENLTLMSGSDLP